MFRKTFLYRPTLMAASLQRAILFCLNGKTENLFKTNSYANFSYPFKYLYRILFINILSSFEILEKII